MRPLKLQKRNPPPVIPTSSTVPFNEIVQYQQKVKYKGATGGLNFKVWQLILIHLVELREVSASSTVE